MLTKAHEEFLEMSKTRTPNVYECHKTDRNSHSVYVFGRQFPEAMVTYLKTQGFNIRVHELS